ncbi:hypothetical protein CMK14_10710 [Candidatus Poribacteria bacterium]|nr:hypothetical protein [Candidatus Poribacteria bacterium]
MQKELKIWLDLLRISLYYTNRWGAYEGHLAAQTHQISKGNSQRIERKSSISELGSSTWHVKPFLKVGTEA